MSSSSIRAATDDLTLVRSRTVHWQDLAGTVAALGQLTPLEHLEQMVKGELPIPPYGALLGIRLESSEPGRVVVGLDAGEHLYNNLGTLHSGAVA